MTKQKPKTRKPTRTRKPSQGESVFQEAWENMSRDMQKVLPAFLTDRFGKGKKGGWIFMVVITIVELVVLGVIGKFIYDWWTGT